MAINLESFEKLSLHVGMVHHITNIGILETVQGIFFVDTGNSDEDGEQLLALTQELYPGKKILGIINTHSHADHCGGNQFITKKTAAKVYAPYTESLIMQIPYVMGAMYWGGNPFDSLKTEGFVSSSINKTDVILKENYVLDLGEILVEAIPLPGHYFDQMGILITDKSENKKSFFLGDGFFGMALLKRFWMPFMYDPEQFRASIQKVENTEADFYIPAHGEYYTEKNISAVAELNVLVTYEFERLIQILLEEKPRNQEDLLKAVADYAGLKLKEGNYILIGTTMRSYLSSLDRRGIITHQMQDNKLIWKIAD